MNTWWVDGLVMMLNLQNILFHVFMYIVCKCPLPVMLQVCELVDMLRCMNLANVKVVI